MIFQKDNFYELSWRVDVELIKSVEEGHFVVSYNNTYAKVVKKMGISKVPLYDNYILREIGFHPSIGIRPYFMLILKYPPLWSQIKNLVVRQPYSFDFFLNWPETVPAVETDESNNLTEPKIATLFMHKCHHTKILMINYKELSEIVSDLGGFGSAVYSVALVVIVFIF